MHPAESYSGLLLASAAVFLGLSLATALAWRELRSIPGLGGFAAAYALIVSSLGLYAWTEAAGTAVAAWLPDMILVAGAALLHDGFRVLYGFPSSWSRRRNAVALGLVLAAVPSAGWASPDGAARSVLVTGLVMALLAHAAALSWRARRPGDPLDAATALSLASCSAVLAVRVGLLLSGDRPAYAITVAAILIGVLASVIWTLAVLGGANRRLGLELSAQHELFASLLSVARLASEGPGLDGALEGTLKLARAATGATGSSLMLLDEKGSFTRGIYTHREKARVLPAPEAEPLLSRGLSGWVARERRSVIVPDVERDERWAESPAPDVEIRSTLAVPIASGAALVGILTLDHAKPHAFDDTHRRLMESAAAQIALVLRNVQIADARLRAAQRERVLNAVLRVAARRLEAQAIARATVDAISDETGWEDVCVAIPDEEGRFRLLATGGVTEQAIDQGVIGRAYVTGQTQLVSDVMRDADYTPGYAGSRSELAVPLRHGTRVLGVLDFERPTADAFGPDEIALCESLAEAVSLGLENARLSREREELINTMVHDLRSPMVSIMGSLQFLRRAKGMESGERRLLEMAERNAERLASLVTSILDVSRLEQGAMRIQPSRFALGPLVGEVLKLAAPRAETSGLELRDEAPGDLPEVEADRALVRRVLENLVGNAIKFSPEGAGPIRVSARVEAPDSVCVRVSDSGPGVDEAARRRLFQKFAPGDHEARGSGLGLAFCRLAVEANGGRLWLAESEGGGACFAFSLRVVEA